MALAGVLEQNKPAEANCRNRRRDGVVIECLVHGFMSEGLSIVAGIILATKLQIPCCHIQADCY